MVDKSSTDMMPFSATTMAPSASTVVKFNVVLLVMPA